MQTFGLLLSIGGLLALLLAAYSMKRARLAPAVASWFALMSVPFALLLGRLMYCACVVDYIMSMDDWGMVLRLDEGGLLPYGMLFGGLLAAVLTARVNRVSPGVVADCAAVPACVAMLFWRIGEGAIGQGRGMALMTWFNEEVGNTLFPTENPVFFERFPFAMQDSYGYWSWAVYVLEALVALVIAFCLWRMRPAKPGGKAALFFLLYAVTQVVCESMRRGNVLRWGFVRVNQIVGAVVILAVLFGCAGAFPAEVRRKKIIAAFVQVLLGAAIVMVMEFALEKKVTMIEFVPSDVCYVIMMAACFWMAWAVRPAWLARFRPEENHA